MSSALETLTTPVLGSIMKGTKKVRDREVEKAGEREVEKAGERGAIRKLSFSINEVNQVRNFKPLPACLG